MALKASHRTDVDVDVGDGRSEVVEEKGEGEIMGCDCECVGGEEVEVDRSQWITAPRGREQLGPVRG